MHLFGLTPILAVIILLLNSVLLLLIRNSILVDTSYVIVVDLDVAAARPLRGPSSSLPSHVSITIAPSLRVGYAFIHGLRFLP